MVAAIQGTTIPVALFRVRDTTDQQEETIVIDEMTGTMTTGATTDVMTAEIETDTMTHLALGTPSLANLPAGEADLHQSREERQHHP